MHLLIYPSDKLDQDKPDYALLFAWSFLDEIKKRNKQYLKNGGKFIVPLQKLKLFNMKNTILILGKNGMVGNATYKYLDLNQSLNVYGTTRKSQSQLKFSANKVEDDFRKIIKKYEKINYVINCIGIKNLDHTDKKQMTEANSLLPKKLDTLANKYKFRLYIYQLTLSFILLHLSY